MLEKNARIIGYDFARGLAIIGMILVNFKIVMLAEESDKFLFKAMEALSGKAAALFVVLAGVGMTLMYDSAKRKGEEQLKHVKSIFLKRALFLLVLGLSYYFIWPADILHYYGVYIAVGVFLLPVNRKWLITLSLIIIVAYSFSMFFFDYEKGWDWKTLEYPEFFTLIGFFRNLFLNGFHPVFPWIAFLLTGFWVGRLNLKEFKVRKPVLILSGLIFLFFTGFSKVLVSVLSIAEPADTEDIIFAFGTSPMPPLFFYMISASSLAVLIITLSVWLTEKVKNNFFIKHMVSTGQLALTNYFTHVVVGMLAIYAIFGELEQAFTIEFIAVYAIIFSIAIVVFSHFWKSKFKRGPIEWLMRKITG